MKILITGANGYIGRSLTNYLSKHHNVTPITRSIVDLTDSKKTKKFFNCSEKENENFDCVIHTAIEGGSRLKKEHDSILLNNLKMHFNLLDNKNYFKKYISFGSGAELMFSETLYGFSKKIIADSILEKNNMFNIRIYGLFDQNEINTRFIKNNMQRYINKQSIEIYEYKKMDFFFMEDFLNLIDYYIQEKNPQKTVNCSYKEKYSLLDIANIINNLDNHKVEIKLNNLKSNDYIGEYNLPINYIGLEKGIIKTYKNLTTNTK